MDHQFFSLCQDLVSDPRSDPTLTCHHNNGVISGAVDFPNCDFPRLHPELEISPNKLSTGMPTSLERLVSDPGRDQTLTGSADGLRITKIVDQCYGPVQKTIVK